MMNDYRNYMGEDPRPTANCAPTPAEPSLAMMMQETRKMLTEGDAILSSLLDMVLGQRNRDTDEVERAPSCLVDEAICGGRLAQDIAVKAKRLLDALGG